MKPVVVGCNSCAAVLLPASDRLAPAERQLVSYPAAPCAAPCAARFRRACPYDNRIPVMKVRKSSGLAFFWRFSHHGFGGFGEGFEQRFSAKLCFGRGDGVCGGF